MSDYLPQTNEEWDQFSEEDLWLKVIDPVIEQSFSELENLMVSNIQLER